MQKESVYDMPRNSATVVWKPLTHRLIFIVIANEIWLFTPESHSYNVESKRRLQKKRYIVPVIGINDEQSRVVTSLYADSNVRHWAHVWKQITISWKWMASSVMSCNLNGIFNIKVCYVVDFLVEKNAYVNQEFEFWICR